MSESATNDRAVGAVLASAVGDALGAPYEFGAPNPTAPCEIEGGGGFGWAPGEWTDDTQMALAVLGVLATGSDRFVADRRRRWCAGSPVARVTSATRPGRCSSDAMRGTAPTEAAAAFQDAHPDAAGNGALMRTGPVALAFIGDRDVVARLAADGRGPDPSAPGQRRRLCAVVAGDRARDHQRSSRRGVRLVRGDPRRARPHRSDSSRAVDARASTSRPTAIPPTSSRSNGWVVAAFQAAIAAITSTADDDQDLPCDHLAAALRLGSTGRR